MSPDAASFDQWYANMARWPQRDEIARRTLGLPADLDSSGLLPGAGLDDLTVALSLAPGQLLVDAACGRGGYGLALARRTGARLIGVDYSATAIGQAQAKARAAGQHDQASFLVGSLTSTGLASGAAAAVMCADAIQFAEPPLAALTEFRRILAPGGRVAVTCWEPGRAAGETGQPPERIQRISLARDLAAAGFTAVAVRHMPAWRAAERAMWEAALAAGPADDPALVSLQQEGTSVLAWLDGTSRVLATATAP
jgi:SAM-dependent methyltransferase